jgi:hypothetical protein
MLNGGSVVKACDVLLRVNGFVFKMAFLSNQIEGEGCRIVMPLWVATITPILKPVKS